MNLTRNRGQNATVESVLPLIGVGLVTRYVRVPRREVVFVKGLFEASEGLGALFAERGGDLIVAAPVSRVEELDELLRDLVDDVGAEIDWDGRHVGPGTNAGARTRRAVE